MSGTLQNIGLKQIRKLVPSESGIHLGNDFFILDVKYDSSLDFLKYPCRSDAYMAIFCKSGELDVEVNLRSYEIREKTLFVGTPGNIIRVSEMPGDPEKMDLVVMAISKEYLSSISFDYRKIFDDSLKILSDPCVQLEDSDIAICIKYMDLFREVMDTDVPNKKEAVASIIASLFYVLGGLIMKNVSRKPQPSGTAANTRVELLFEHFMSLVTEYHSTERNMSFYANRLGLTPKYLSKLIKQVSGRSAPDWIDSFVILEAKNLLKYSDVSIKEIVYQLNFPNPSVFYKFFKAHTGMTPSEYRNG